MAGGYESKSRLCTFVETVTSIVYSIMFVFEMPKVVHIRNIWLGLFFRAVQLFILVYFTLYVMWWNQGYQSFERSVNGVMAKVNAITWLETPYWRGHMKPQFYLFDNGEYELQSLQKSGLYLVTRLHTLKVQALGYCPETNKLPDAICHLDQHCPLGESAGISLTSFDGTGAVGEEIDLREDGHGVFTGKCIKVTNTCEIYGWCPVDVNVERKTPSEYVLNPSPKVLKPPNILAEPYSLFTDLKFLEDRRRIIGLDPLAAAPLYDILNATIFIKNAIEFPHFKVKRRNILPWMSEEYVTQCLYNPTDPKDRYCPVFRVGQILELAGVSAYRLLHFGGVIAITIDWDCNLDLSVNRCLPEYTFRQLDGPQSSESAVAQTLGEGSMQDIVVHVQNDRRDFASRQRFLLQTTGMVFLIRVNGKAGKFNLLRFTMKLGSGLALLGGATIVCDLIVFHLLDDRKHYKQATRDDRTLRRLLSMTTATSTFKAQREQWFAPLVQSNSPLLSANSDTQSSPNQLSFSTKSCSCRPLVGTQQRSLVK